MSAKPIIITEENKARWQVYIIAKSVLTNECYEWLGQTNKKGYGQGWFDGIRYLVHRVAYALHYGTISTELVLDHSCKNHKCWNPLHLEEITNKENILKGDGLTAQNARKTHCNEGHLLEAPKEYKQGKVRLCEICRQEARVRYRMKIKAKSI